MNRDNSVSRCNERLVRGEPGQECSTQVGNVQTAAEKTEYFAPIDRLQRMAGARKQSERYVRGWSPLACCTLRRLTSAGQFNCNAAIVQRSHSRPPRCGDAFNMALPAVRGMMCSTTKGEFEKRLPDRSSPQFEEVEKCWPDRIRIDFLPVVMYTALTYDYSEFAGRAIDRTRAPA
jgi:hypothetical protein